MTETPHWLRGRLVVPLDGREASTRAVPLAGRIARRLGLEFRLVSVVESDAETGARMAWLQDIAADQAPDTETEVLTSDSLAHAIAATVDNGGLICMATAGKVRFHSGHFGSVAESVAKLLDQPLLMVGPHVDPDPPTPTGRVVLPFDGSALARAAGEPAAELAAALGVPLWVISVVSAAAEAAEAAKHQGKVIDRASAGREFPEELGAKHGIESRWSTVHSEEPQHAIVDFVGDDGTAVMSTHGRGGLSRLFAGSVTAGVVAHSRRAVVVLRPTHDG